MQQSLEMNVTADRQGSADPASPIGAPGWIESAHTISAPAEDFKAGMLEEAPDARDQGR
jgi:hypothetical protein